MSNRFTTPEKWNDKWFRSLTPHQKLLWGYLCDNCNLAGFIELDNDKISFDTKLSIEEIKAAIKGLARGYVGANDWVWIKNFLKHQKNLPLNPLNNAHKHIISKINDQAKNFNLTEIAEYLGANQGLFSPIGIDKGKGIGNGTLGKEGGVGEEKPFIELAEIPANVLEAAEMNQFTHTKERNTEFIIQNWETFLVERSHDPPEKIRLHQKNHSELYQYFLNWIRNKFPKNESHKQNNTHSRKQRGARQLLDDLKQDISSRRGPNDSS